MKWYLQRSSLSTAEGYYYGSHRTYQELLSDMYCGDLPEGCLQTRESGLDYEPISDTNLLGFPIEHRVPIRVLRHVTNEDGAVKIYHREGFTGTWKFVYGVRPMQRYTWWAVHALKGTARKAVQQANRREGAGTYSCSGPFLNRAQIYGNFAFDLNADDLFEQYKEQFCQNSQMNFRIMGTFVYNTEIMYAVLVHSSKFDHRFCHLPLLSRRTHGQRIQRSKKGRFFWTPESVVQRIVEPYSTWEGLAFAFHLPGKYSVFHVDDIADALKIIPCDRYKGKVNISAGQACSSILRRRDVRGTYLASKLIRSRK